MKNQDFKKLRVDFNFMGLPPWPVVTKNDKFPTPSSPFIHKYVHHKNQQLLTLGGYRPFCDYNESYRSSAQKNNTEYKDKKKFPYNWGNLSILSNLFMDYHPQSVAWTKEFLKKISV